MAVPRGEEEEISAYLCHARCGCTRTATASSATSRRFNSSRMDSMSAGPQTAPRVAPNDCVHCEGSCVRDVAFLGVVADEAVALKSVTLAGSLTASAPSLCLRMRKHDHVAGLVPRGSSRARLGEVRLHLAHLGGFGLSEPLLCSHQWSCRWRRSWRLPRRRPRRRTPRWATRPHRRARGTRDNRSVSRSRRGSRIQHLRGDIHVLVGLQVLVHRGRDGGSLGLRGLRRGLRRAC